MSHLQDAAKKRGSETLAWARSEIRRLKLVADKKRGGRLISGRDQVTPPLQSDRERGEGDSINSRMHRLLGGQR